MIMSSKVNIDKLPQMYELAHRANINVYTIEIDGIQKYVVLYEDHRTILNVLYFARMKGILSSVPNLIYFDYHDDACEIYGGKLEEMKALPISEENFKMFWQFIEFSLGAMDDDWVWAGMYLDLIKNAVRIGGSQDDNIQRINEVFNPIGKYLHPIYHLDEELAYKGCFTDAFSHTHEADYHVRSIFDANFATEENTEKDTPFVLDFDLDCFTGEVDHKTIAWPEMIFRKHYEDNFKAKQFLRKLVKNSAFITICREPGCCGGIGESNKILTYLDHYLFDNQLKTMPLV